MRVLWCALIQIALFSLPITYSQAQTYGSRGGNVDIFMGTELNYKDITHERVYDLLINLTPGVKWNMGQGWMISGQAFIPVVNQYGGYYKKVRLNMATLSHEGRLGNNLYIKKSIGLFGLERYGADLKLFYPLTDWLALDGQMGYTGFCSMATGWKCSKIDRFTGTAGIRIYLSPSNTEFRAQAGRYIYGDYGAIGEAMRHFKHCTVGLYAQISDVGGTASSWQRNGGFKIVMMIPPYTRRHRKVNIRPASNFRLTYNIEANQYANKVYTTDPEQNERNGWFSRDLLRWGSTAMDPDFIRYE